MESICPVHYPFLFCLSHGIVHVSILTCKLVETNLLTIWQWSYPVKSHLGNLISFPSPSPSPFNQSFIYQTFICLLPISVSCGYRPSGSSRIVGGTVATVSSWPWQAMLRDVNGRQFCGASLIHPQWVSTATHCVSGKSPSSVKVG